MSWYTPIIPALEDEVGESSVLKNKPTKKSDSLDLMVFQLVIPVLRERQEDQLKANLDYTATLLKNKYPMLEDASYCI